MSQTALTLPELARIVGIEYRTLHTWVRRGLLEPSVRRSDGTGTPNLFGVGDAVGARVLADLRRAGLSMDVLESASQALRDSEEALERPAVLLVNGNVEIFPDAPSTAEALDRPGLSLVYRTRDALAHVSAALTAH
jgi:DNA-binding transcriptional MerR regulator